MKNQRDNNIMWRTLSTANIEGIGKTVTLGQALFSFLGYRFIGDSVTTPGDFSPDLGFFAPIWGSGLFCSNFGDFLPFGICVQFYVKISQIHDISFKDNT